MQALGQDVACDTLFSHRACAVRKGRLRRRAMRSTTVGTALFLSAGSLALCAGGTLEAQDVEAVEVAHHVEGSVPEAAGALGVVTPEDAPPAPQRLPGVTRADALLASRACAHESTFRGGRGGTYDCGAQIQVIQTRRRLGETFSHALLRTMPRFAAHTTSRSWVHALPDGPIRGEIAGWPYAYPARHDSDAWSSVFARVTDFMLGREPLPCVDPPEHWFSRLVDGDAIAARVSSGRWVETDCNPGGAPETQTLNAYLTRRVRLATAEFTPSTAVR